ncbi:MAG: pseudaminic acid cytidylyltransferase [Magnetospiraceae bacterium]
MRIAVIPARGGSKRIPGKNIRDFAGKPMIAYPIAAALDSGLFDAVRVSTDTETVADVARVAGALVDGKRPAELADDHATILDVMAHEAGPDGDPADWICLIYATAPMLDAALLTESWRALEARIATGEAVDYLVSVATFAYPVQRALSIRQGLTMMDPAHLKTRSQDLEPAYHDAALFAWGRRGAWAAKRPLFSERSRPFIVPRFRVQDIDEPEDWETAELLYAVARQRGML